MGNESWLTLNWKAQLTNSTEFVTGGSTVEAGEWIAVVNASGIVGSTYFAAESQNDHKNTTEAVECLEVISYFDVEFREPTPDRGNAFRSYRIEPVYRIPPPPLRTDERKEQSKQIVNKVQPDDVDSLRSTFVVVRKGVG